jgi:hypothetical protein
MAGRAKILPQRIGLVRKPLRLLASASSIIAQPIPSSRDRGVDLLMWPGPCRLEVSASVGLADYIADAGQHKVSNVGKALYLSDNRISEKTLQIPCLLILHHSAAHRHYERDCRVDLLVRTKLGWIQVAAPVRLADDITDAPREDWVPIVTQPTSPHRGVELDNRGAEVLRDRPEFVRQAWLPSRENKIRAIVATHISPRSS